MAQPRERCALVQRVRRRHRLRARLVEREALYAAATSRRRGDAATDARGVERTAWVSRRSARHTRTSKPRSTPCRLRRPASSRPASLPPPGPPARPCSSGVGRWDGTSWNGYGLGVESGSACCGYITALAGSNHDLYAGGYFVTAGQTALNNFAHFNGTSWSTSGAGSPASDYDQRDRDQRQGRLRRRQLQPGRRRQRLEHRDAGTARGGTRSAAASTTPSRRCSCTTASSGSGAVHARREQDRRARSQSGTRRRPGKRSAATPTTTSATSTRSPASPRRLTTTTS